MRSRTDLALAVLVLALALALPGGGRAVEPLELDLSDLAPSGEGPAPVDVRPLVDELAHTSPSVRERAIDKLRAMQERAAPAVTRRLTQPGLLGQLGALEVLRAWKAPVGEVDPWDPRSLDATRPRLERWAASEARTRPTTPVGPTPRELDEDFEMLFDANDERADAAIERLVRGGDAVKARVRALMTRITDPRHRRRVDVLRFRRAMPAKLEEQSPDLPYRLAIAAGQSRAQVVAAIEQSDLTDARELLRELVADPEALVREAAVKALRRAEQHSQLGALLNDPDPNVRAAVLKELSSSPAPKLVKRLRKYVTVETDEDLLVHAVRALAQIEGRAAMDALFGLAKHPRWRVRAEVIERVGARVAKNAFASLKPDVKARVVDLVVALLDDADPFVVGRALQVVKPLDQPLTLPPLTRVVARHPELAVAAVKAIDTIKSMRPAVEMRLQQYAKSATVDVQVVAVEALVRRRALTSPADTLGWLDAADARVRTAATGALAGAADSATSGYALRAMYGELIKKRAAGAALPERIAIARALAHMRDEESSLPIVLDLVWKDPESFKPLADTLKVYSWDGCKKVYDLLRSRPRPDAADVVTVLAALLHGSRKRTRALLWDILGEPKVDDALFARVFDQLFMAYDVSQGYPMPESEARAEFAADAAARLDAARPAQATVALMVLMMRRREVGEPIARGFLEGATAGAELELNALKLLLCARGVGAKRKLALAQIERGGPGAEAALAYLAVGRRAPELTRLTVEGHTVQVMAQDVSTTGLVAPLPPPDLTAALLVRYLEAPDRKALYAANLLSLLGDPRGVPVLAQRWRDDPMDAEQLLILDALVILDRDEDTPLLEDVVDAMVKESERRRAALDRLALMTNRSARELLKKVRARPAPESLDELGRDLEGL